MNKKIKIYFISIFILLTACNKNETTILEKELNSCFYYSSNTISSDLKENYSELKYALNEISAIKAEPFYNKINRLEDESNEFRLALTNFEGITDLNKILDKYKLFIKSLDIPEQILHDNFSKYDKKISKKANFQFNKNKWKLNQLALEYRSLSLIFEPDIDIFPYHKRPTVQYDSKRIKKGSIFTAKIFLTNSNYYNNSDSIIFYNNNANDKFIIETNNKTIYKEKTSKLIGIQKRKGFYGFDKHKNPYKISFEFEVVK